jgi:hypothetical protein
MLPTLNNDAGLEYTFNDVMDALSPAAYGARNGMAAAGSRFPVFGGGTLNGLSALSNAGGEVREEPSLDVKPTGYPFYVFEEAEGGLSRDAVVPPGARVLQTLTSASTWVDNRDDPKRAFSKINVAVADVNTTLTAAQLSVRHIIVTGALTADRILTFGGYGVWIVQSAVGGGKNILLDNSVTVPPGSTYIYARVQTVGGVVTFHACSNYNAPGSAFVGLTDTVPALAPDAIVHVNATPNGMIARSGEPWIVTAMTSSQTPTAAAAGTWYRTTGTSSFNVTLNSTLAIGFRIKMTRGTTGTQSWVAGSGVTIRKIATKGLAVLAGGTSEALKISATEFVVWGDL